MSPGEDHSRPAGAVQLAPGLWRTDLQQHELSVRGGEVVQQCAAIGPDATPVKHTRPGEQFICILEGSLEHQIEGQPPRTCNAGDGLTVPARAVHAARNTGSGNVSEFGGYIAERTAGSSRWPSERPSLRYEHPLTAPARRKGGESSRRRAP